jgi:hypothetical protein
MIPTPDENIVAEGQGLLTSRYVTAPNTNAILTALLARIQQIEDSYWSLIDAVQLANHPMPGGPWDVLDKLGSIVGALRNGLDDADYLALIKLQAKVNRSRGTAEDVLGLAALMSGTSPPVYLEMPPAAFYLGCWDIALNYPIFTPLLAQARAAGVYGLFAYTSWADGNDLQFGSTYDPDAGQGGFGSRYDSNAGGLLVAATVI